MFIVICNASKAIKFNYAYRKLINDFGIWNQIRVDMGREWFLMLYVQEQLSQHRYDTTKPAYLQTSSKQVIRNVISNCLVNLLIIIVNITIYHTESHSRENMGGT